MNSDGFRAGFRRLPTGSRRVAPWPILVRSREDAVPENDVCEAVVASLEREHARIGELLRELGGDRRWSDRLTGVADGACLPVHACLIETCVDDIARIVASMKDRTCCPSAPREGSRRGQAASHECFRAVGDPRESHPRSAEPALSS